MNITLLGQSATSMLIEDWDRFSIEDLIEAIEGRIPEGKEIEYKRELDVSNDSHKETFVGEVCSFANADGGDLVIGIQEANGVAGILYPFQCENVDDLINRWVQILTSHTDPSLPQRYVDMKAVEINENHSDHIAEDAPETGYALVVRVLPSHHPLHQETYSATFYERSASGKSPLDTSEVQRLLHSREEFERELDELASTRVEAVQSNNLDTKVRQDHPLAILHVIPRSTFDRTTTIDPNAAHVTDTLNNDQTYPPLLSTDGITPGPWYDFDGERYISGRELPQYEDDYGHPVFGAYTKTHRDGYIEAVGDSVGRWVREHQEYSHPFFVDGGNLRGMLEGPLEQYVQFLGQEGADFPMYCYLTLLNTEGLAFGMGIRTSLSDPRRRISRDRVQLPRLIISSPRDDLDVLLDQLMDNVFQLGGYAGEPRIQN